MIEHPRVPLDFFGIRFPVRIRILFLPPTFAVLNPLLKLPFLSTVISGATARRTLLAMRVSAAEGTTQVPATGVAWMGDEEKPAMLAASQAWPQAGMGS